MASISNFQNTLVQNKWLEWINSPIHFDELDRIEEPITVRQYLETIFIKLFNLFRERKIYFKIRDNLILNDVVNYYFHLWRGAKKIRTPYNYSLTLFGKEQRRQGYRQNTEIIEHLDSIFTDLFWRRLQNEFGRGYGIFDPELSDFGEMFWENIRYFLYQYVETENIACNIYSDNHEPVSDQAYTKTTERTTNTGKDNLVNIAYKKNSKTPLDDPYLVDQQVARESGNLW